MSEPIDLDDLQRVGVLVREKTADNWLADMVELACDEIARLREERDTLLESEAWGVACKPSEGRLSIRKGIGSSTTGRAGDGPDLA